MHTGKLVTVLLLNILNPVFPTNSSKLSDKVLKLIQGQLCHIMIIHCDSCSFHQGEVLADLAESDWVTGITLMSESKLSLCSQFNSTYINIPSSLQQEFCISFVIITNQERVTEAIINVQNHDLFNFANTMIIIPTSGEGLSIPNGFLERAFQADVYNLVIGDFMK